MAATNGAAGKFDLLDEISNKAPPGTVLPPRGMRDIIEKTAGYVVRSGRAFEARLRDNPKMTFVNPEDAYYAYYQWRLSEISAGKGNVISAGREGEAAAGYGVSGKGREERKGPSPPEEFKFSARMPNISAQDLEVVKLTALFTAKNGRNWMTTLSQREAGNFQFDFLRPQHTLYQFFSRLVDQYTDLLTGGTVDGGRPQKKRIAELQQNVDNRFRVIERAKKRAEWVKYQETQKVAKEEQEEKERITFAQIDWHDFVVVETVVFDERDENIELPRPTTINDLQSASLEQKAAMSINPNRRIEEAMPTFADYDQFYGSQTTPAPAVQMPLPPQSYTPQPLAGAHPTPPPQPFQPPALDEASRASTLAEDRARARAAQEAARANPAQPKIRTDYIPRAQARRAAQQQPNTSICPNCGVAIPNDEIEQHMRIEMMDPASREQKRIAAQRSSTTNLSTQDVADNLKRLASQRTDVFDPVTGRVVVSEEEAERRRRAERRMYDGVSGVPSQAALGGMGMAIGGGGGGAADGSGDAALQSQTPRDVQEQIRQLHQKYKS